MEELITAQRAPVVEFGSAGFLPRDGSGGKAGFADGGVSDILAPGGKPGRVRRRRARRLAALTDDQLIGVIRAWQRQTSWAQVRELAAITELVRRRSVGRPVAPAPARAERVHRRPDSAGGRHAGGWLRVERADCAKCAQRSHAEHSVATD